VQSVVERVSFPHEGTQGLYRTLGDEVITRQCPCLGLSIHGAYVGAWRIQRLQTEIGGAHEFTQVRPPGG
jgi:hypothetical protein